MSWKQKQDSLEPSWVGYVKDSDGVAVDITAADSVRFIMRLRGDTGTPKVAATAAVSNGATGEVTYDWVSGDTDTAGIYDTEVEVIWPTSRPQRFPGEHFGLVHISPSLGG